MGIGKNFPGKGVVAALKTQPGTVLDDYRKVMELAGYREALPAGHTTLLKINISWQTWYPACSTAPWQLEGVIKTLKADGYTLVGAHNDTVVVDTSDGEVNNKHKFVTDLYGIPCMYLYKPDVKWITYTPKQPFLVLDTVYPEGVDIPEPFVGTNIVHLPTIKCVHPDTEVVLADGALTRIADLVEESLKRGGVALLDEDGDTRIPAHAALLSLSDGGQLGPQMTRFFWRTPLNGRKIWWIRTKTGREVKVSSEHPFLTPQGWQKAAALQPGDRIAIPRKINVEGKSQPLPSLKSPNWQAIDPDALAFTDGHRFSADVQREIARAYLAGEAVKQIAQAHAASTTSVKRIVFCQAGIEPRGQRNWAVTAPTQTSPEFWQWVGYFTAEGYISPKNYFVMVNSDPVIQADYVALTRQLFNLEVIFQRGKEAKFRSDQLAEFFAQLGWTPPLKAESKRVLTLLFKCTDEEIAAFLAGYFDGDATISPGSDPDKHSYALTATSKSERLIIDVQYLLTRLGVVSFKHSMWSKVASSHMEKRLYHTLRVYGADLAYLAHHIRLLSRHKQTLLEAAFEVNHDTNWDTVPLPPDLIKEARTGLGLSQRALAQPHNPAMISMIESSKRTPSRKFAQHIITALGQHDHSGKLASVIAQLQGLMCEAIAWDHVDTVEAVEPDTEYLYDFTMEAAPSFVGNGMFLHNTHVFTTITGSLKNSFGGLLHRKRHWTHAVIHDTLVDLLQIQQDIHEGLFAVMDGTFAGDGPGPRAMRWHEKDIILASADQVAIDAISARLQGFDPMAIRFIRRAHEAGMGIGDPKQIKVVGYDIEQEPAWNFKQEDTFASRGQKLIYHGPLKPLEGLLLRSPIVPWSYFASNFYHNVYWYPFVGRPRVQAALNTKWGRLFAQYGDGRVVMPGMQPETVAVTAAGLTALASLIAGGLILRRKK